MAVEGKFGLQEGLDLTKSILPIIGAIAAASQLRKNEKQVKGIGQNLANTINKEKQVKALDRVQNRAFLKQGDALAREKKAMAKRGVASGAINIDRGVADSYGDAVRNIAASTSARNEYLKTLEDKVANANAERNNYFSDMKAKAWASAANESIKAAQNYKPAGDVASKDATKVEVETPQKPKVSEETKKAIEKLLKPKTTEEILSEKFKLVIPKPDLSYLPENLRPLEYKAPKIKYGL